ncbi:MAG: ribosome silencing factor [Tepidisphaeraceae bacterium]
MAEVPEEVVIAAAVKKKHKAATADSRAFAIEIAKLANDSRCHSVVVLDVREVSPVTDFLVLGTGTSDRQMKGVGNEIERMAEEQHDEHVMSRAKDENWILLDFVNVVVHLFSQDARMYYDLDSLWGDAKRVDWK